MPMHTLLALTDLLHLGGGRQDHRQFYLGFLRSYHLLHLSLYISSHVHHGIHATVRKRYQIYIIFCKYFVYHCHTHKQYLKKKGNNSHNEQHIEALRLSWSFVWLKKRLKKSSPKLPRLANITSSKIKQNKNKTKNKVHYKKM